MKGRKYRDFVSRACKILKEEVTASKIEILEVEEDDNGINFVKYKNRYGRIYTIRKAGRVYLYREVE